MSDTIPRKPVSRLEPGDRVIFAAPEAETRPVRTVDHTMRMPLGVVRIFHGLHGLQHVDAAGTHRIEMAP